MKREILCSSTREDPPMMPIERVERTLCGSLPSAQVTQAQRNLEAKRERIPWRNELRPAWKGNGLLPMEGK
jgi:hypothetical protein